MMKCKSCQKEIDEYSKFCGYCGVRIISDSEQPITDHTEIEDSSISIKKIASNHIDEKTDNQQINQTPILQEKDAIIKTGAKWVIVLALLLIIIVIGANIIKNQQEKEREKRQLIEKQNNIEQMISKGDENFKNNRYEEAAFEYTQAKKLDPTNQIIVDKLARAKSEIVNIETKKEEQKANELKKQTEQTSEINNNVNQKIKKEGANDNQKIQTTKQNFNNTNGTFTDLRDGKIYEWIKIGKQIWMAENLAFNAGAGSWAYNNNENNVTIYGRLYDWETACKSCPEGWHLPSDQEWNILISYLGGENVAGGKMKETGITYWESPNTAATNTSGFSGLPGDFRNKDGTFTGLGYSGYWWSSTESDSSNAWRRYLSYYYSNVYRYHNDKNYGLSVRCIKD